MTPFLCQALKIFNVVAGFILSLWIISESFALFAIVVALFVTYLNHKIDEILERAD